MEVNEVGGDDVIELNVGGQHMATKRSTLCQVEGSLLAVMFSGRWEDAMSCDKDGRVFLDFNPKYFSFILDYLRAKKISSPENPAPSPKVESNEAKSFNNLIHYLGLGEELLSVMPKRDFFSFTCGDIALSKDATVAEVTSHSDAFVVGNNVYDSGINSFKLKVMSKYYSGYLHVGVVRGDLSDDVFAVSTPRFYGWRVSDHIMCSEECTWSLHRRGDGILGTFHLTLDCTKGILFLMSLEGCHFTLELPALNTWRLFIKMEGLGQKAEIVELRLP